MFIASHVDDKFTKFYGVIAYLYFNENQCMLTSLYLQKHVDYLMHSKLHYVYNIIVQIMCYLCKINKIYILKHYNT